MNEIVRKSLEHYSNIFGIEKAKEKLEEHKNKIDEYEEKYIFWDKEHLLFMIDSYFNKANVKMNIENLDDSYDIFYIKKKKKGHRMITSPKEYLKDLQVFINENILQICQTSEYAHGYVFGRSIITNALEHCNKKVVICMDIEDFFGNINRDSVINVFLNLNYNKEISEILAAYCMYNNGLAVGAPTSPTISNMVFKEIDYKLNNIASEYGFDYTRYADDMTFSSNDSKIGYKKFVSLIKMELNNMGYRINEKKTKIYTKRGKQEVTGLIVNNGIKVKSIIKKKVKAEIYYCKKFGIDNHIRRKYSDEFNKNNLDEISEEKKRAFIYYIEGKINFIKLVEPLEGKRIEREYLKMVGKYKEQLGRNTNG